MRPIRRKLFTVPFSSTEKRILTKVARATGMSGSGLIRQLLRQKHQTLVRKALARSDG